MVKHVHFQICATRQMCLKEVILLGARVHISNEVFGSDTFIDDFVGGKKVTVGEIYFKPDKLRNWSAGSYQTLDLFEKIRMVGKGNYLQVNAIILNIIF